MLPGVALGWRSAAAMAGLWKPKWSRAFAVNNGPLVETCWHARWRSPYKHTTPHRLSSVDRPKWRQRQRLRRRRRRRLVVMEGSYQDKSKAAAAAAAAVVVPSRATSNVTVAKPWRDLQLLEAGALRPFERPTNFTTAGLRRAPPYATLSNCFFTYVGPGRGRTSSTGAFTDPTFGTPQQPAVPQRNDGGVRDGAALQVWAHLRGVPGHAGAAELHVCAGHGFRWARRRRSPTWSSQATDREELG